MNKKNLLGFFLVFTLLVFSSSLITSRPIPVDDVLEGNFFKEDYYYREGDGIYIDSDKNFIMVGGQSISVKWGYDEEIIYSGRIATKDNPYNLLVPFWFEHQLPIAIDPCKGELAFVSTPFSTSVDFLWDYNVPIPFYSYKAERTTCIEEVEIEEGEIWCMTDVELFPIFCDIGISGSNCVWTKRTIEGYNQKTKSKWRDVDSLESCQLEAGKRYNFRHKASVPAGSSILFDVNAVFAINGIDKFVFTIPEPEWVSTAPDDYNTGTGFDFNWTKVTGDANVMPTGSDRVYVESDQTFYDSALVAYIDFDDVNADGSGVLDDTNNNNDGLLVNGADINAWGMWDTNAGFFDGVDDFVSLGNDNFGMDSTNEFTITLWVKYEETPDNFDTLISKAQYVRPFTIGWQLGFFYTTMRTADDTYTMWGQSGSFTVGEWHHIAFTYADGTQTLYVNGTVDVTDSDPTGNLVLTGEETTIGVNCFDCSYWTKGLIDEVKIYNRALTRDEIQQDFNAWMVSPHYYSPIKDAEEAVNWDKIQWFENTDQNNSLTVDYRGCSASDCSAALTYMQTETNTFNTG
jgi:hypothetical protein